MATFRSRSENKFGNKLDRLGGFQKLKIFSKQVEFCEIGVFRKKVLPLFCCGLIKVFL
jgi:hypothetical protein